MIEVFTPLQAMYIEEMTHILEARENVKQNPLNSVAVSTVATIDFFKKENMQRAIDHIAFARWLDLRGQNLADIGSSLVKERL